MDRRLLCFPAVLLQSLYWGWFCGGGLTNVVVSAEVVVALAPKQPPQGPYWRRKYGALGGALTSLQLRVAEPQGDVLLTNHLYCEGGYLRSVIMGSSMETVSDDEVTSR